MVAEPLPVTLHPQTGEWYGGLYGELDEMGLYRVVVYAQDEQGLQSRPKEILTWTGWSVYLPLVIKQ